MIFLVAFYRFKKNSVKTLDVCLRLISKAALNYNGLHLPTVSIELWLVTVWKSGASAETSHRYFPLLASSRGLRTTLSGVDWCTWNNWSNDEMMIFCDADDSFGNRENSDPRPEPWHRSLTRYPLTRQPPIRIGCPVFPINNLYFQVVCFVSKRLKRLRSFDQSLNYFQVVSLSLEREREMFVSERLGDNEN